MAPNAAPILGSLNDVYTVEVGLELALDLEGTDPDDDPISFFATPLPLPTGVTLDAVSGALRYRPEEGQLGDYTFTVGVSDGVLTDIADITISVIDPSQSDTSVFGRVLDASDFANGVETPLANMPVRLADAALMTTTDANGEFSFGGLTGGADRVIIEPSELGGPGGYLGAARNIRVTENQNRDLAPEFLLTPLNAGCSPVVAGLDTVVADASLGVTVTIPADSVLNADGTAYTGDICLGALPTQAEAEGLPSDTTACRIYAIDAPGATFAQGASVSAPNDDLLPETTRLALWASGASAGLFSRSADAFVDPGAATVSGSLPGLQSSSLITFLPQPPKSVASADQPTGMQYLTAFEGDLNEVYRLPSYRAFNETQTVGLSYRSSAANPEVIIAGDVTIEADASLPVTLSSKLAVGGLAVVDENEWTPRQGANGETPALVGETLTLRQSSVVDGSGIESGHYDVQFTAKANYACSTVATSHDAEFYLKNETDSPYGVGWSIEDLQELHVNPDGSVVIIDDNGFTPFDPQPGLTSFDSAPFVFPSVGTTDVLVDDIDDDGLPDVVYSETGNGEVGVIRNLGENGFEVVNRESITTGTSVPTTGTFPVDLASINIGDFDANGEADIGYILNQSRRYGSFTLSQAGMINLELEYPVVEGQIFATDGLVVDLDNDGFDDFVYTGRGQFFFSVRARAYVRYGGPNGLENEQEIVRFGGGTTIGQPLEVIAGDIDGDGNLDLALRTNRGVNFVFNNGGRNYTYSRPRLGGDGVFLFGDYSALIDANRDGLLDVVRNAPGLVQVFLNSTGRTFNTQPIELPIPAGTSGDIFFEIADENGDGIDDIVTSSFDGVSVYRGNGDGTFQPVDQGVTNYSFRVMTVADLNNDGSLDLITGQRFSVTVHLSTPSASGRFVSGNGDFSTLVRNEDGTYTRRYKDGMLVEFDANGLQVARVDQQGNRFTYGYGADNRMETMTDQVGGVTSFAYDNLGRMQSITYPDGRETSFVYDDAVQLTEITEPEGSKVSFAYNDDGRLVSTTNQNGNATNYNYDATGKLNGATMADGSTVAMQIASSLGLVDGLGQSLPQPLVYVKPEDRVTTVTDRKGEITTVEVNEFGSLVRTTDPIGRTTNITRDAENRVIRVERPSESAPGGIRVDEMEYDNLNNVTVLREAVGSDVERAMLYEYEPEFSRVTKMTDGDGFETKYEYDAFGEVTKIVDAELGEQIFTYTPEGKMATRADENGNVTSFAYNTQQNLSEITYADNSISRMTYDAVGNTTVIAEAADTPIERQVRRVFDLHNRVTSVEVTQADGVEIDGVTSYTYLPAGNLETVTDETGLVTTMAYDGLERLISVNDPAEGLSQRVYNAAGEIISQINGDGEIHAYEYDAVSRLTRVTDPEGFIKLFDYDSRDLTTLVTDGRDGLTSFGYDALDRMTLRTDPLGFAIARSYDARANLTALTREDGAAETAVYDGLSRRTQVVTPDNTLVYGYDAYGNLTLAADDDTGVSFTYDARNRIATTTTDGTVGPQPEVTLTYTYDELDRRTQLTDSLGGVYGYEWDQEDRLTKLTAPWGTEYDFAYDGFGRRTSLTSSTGRVSTYAYENGLLSELRHVQSGTALTDLAYGYDVDGQLTSITDNLDPSKSKAITYDQLNRLVEVAEGVPVSQGGLPVPIEDYVYDEEGNRLASHVSAAYTSSAHNQLIEDDIYTYAYDAKGNRVNRTNKASGDEEAYTYDSQNRLISYVSPTTTATYAYDALERRVSKNVNGSNIAYIYDFSAEDPLAHDDILMEWKDENAPSLSRRWAHTALVDEPIGFEDYLASSDAGSGAERSLFSNRQSSILWVTDPETGTALVSYNYDAYGGRTVTSGSLDQPYGYTGREFDPESGHIYFRARTYDPVTGSFIQSDPIGFVSKSLNVYGYVHGNPTRFVDPNGLTTSSTNLVARKNFTTPLNKGIVSQVGGRAWGLVGGILQALARHSQVIRQVRSDRYGVARVSFEGLPPPGDCRPQDQESLQSRVDRAKDEASRYGKCLPVHGPAERALRYRAWSELAEARTRINNICFRGGNAGHQDAADIAWEKADECF